ncbi:MAG: N-formylglutamate amidohydrolase, partial [Parvibaculum sp.]
DIYMPFLETLRLLLENTLRQFGKAILIDCHSMPSTPGLTGDNEHDRPDIVLGDRYGTACAPGLIERTESILQAMGYRVARNNPYAGGFNTEHYGAPAHGLHALQIEINRTLYMNEHTVERTRGINKLSKDMTHLVQELGRDVRKGLSLEPHRRAS